MRGVVSVYYGNVIAEAGPGSAAPVCSQVARWLRLAFCSTSPTEMSSLSPSKLTEDAAPTQLFSPELAYIKHKRRAYMKNAQSAGI